MCIFVNKKNKNSFSIYFDKLLHLLSDSGCLLGWFWCIYVIYFNNTDRLSNIFCIWKKMAFIIYVKKLDVIINIDKVDSSLIKISNICSKVYVIGMVAKWNTICMTSDADATYVKAQRKYYKIASDFQKWEFNESYDRYFRLTRLEKYQKKVKRMRS